MFRNKSVLTIDNSDTIRSYLKSVLLPLGARVEGAASGQEGLAKSAQGQYNLILLDLILPDMSGIEILQRIRQTNTTSAVVMITGHGGIRSAISATQLGADGYLQKQELTGAANDHSEFLYALDQALTRRAGLVAKDQLEAMRVDFYSMVTHDLRNPAFTVQAALDMVLEDTSSQLTPSQGELISVARSAAIRMLGLINDYLDYAKIDAGYLRLDIHDVELRRLIQESSQLSILQARARQQTLTLDLPPEPVWAFADSERLKQVLDNLLSNACKYTEDGGTITVQLRTEVNKAIFRVTDTGMGIPPSQLSSLFAKFHRVPGETVSRIRGTGLGLLIAKEIVEAHEGTIRAISEGVPGKGTTFEFTIPLEPANLTPETLTRGAYVVQPRQHEQVGQTEPLKPAESADESSVSAPFDDEFLRTFLEESQGHLRQLRDNFRQLARTPNDHQLVKNAQHISHTLRGNAGAIQLTTIADLASRIDDTLRKAVKGDMTLTTLHVTHLIELLGKIDVELANI